MRIRRVPFIGAKSKRRSRREIVAPVPRPFNFGFTAHRPLVPLAAVTMFLNRNARDVLSLIEDGKLRWAFDIRSANAARREVRVLRQSLFEYVGLYTGEAAPAETEREEFANIMELILPRGVVLSPLVFNSIRPGSCAPGARSFHLKLRLPVSTVALLQRELYPQEPVLRATEIARCFSCINQHVSNLIKEQSLRVVNLRRGPKASPLVPRPSVVEFLEKRRMS